MPKFRVRPYCFYTILYPDSNVPKILHKEGTIIELDSIENDPQAHKLELVSDDEIVSDSNTQEEHETKIPDDAEQQPSDDLLFDPEPEGKKGAIQSAKEKLRGSLK